MKYYTSKQLAELFGVSLRTLYNWRKKGLLRYKKVTRKTIVYEEDSVKKAMEGK